MSFVGWLRNWASVVAIACATPTIAAPPTAIKYQVEIPAPGANRIHVTLVASGTRGTPFTIALPAWSPGWYVVDNSHRGVSDLVATDPDGTPRTLTTAGERRWSVDPAGSDTVEVRYTVAADDTGHGFFRPHVCDSHAFVPGPTTLAYAEGATDVPCTVEYRVPDGWKVASGNQPVEGSTSVFRAPDYDTLADHPADLGKFSTWSRDVGGIPVQVVAVGAGAASAERLAEKLFQLNAVATHLLGPSPFPRYVWHVRLADDPTFMGGLEHLNGCVLRISPMSSGSIRTGDLRLAAHELVHAWIAKRIRPAGLGPFDYSQPFRTPDLWFLEGVVDTLAPRLVVAAGFADESWWREDLARQLSQLLSNPSRNRVSVAEASRKVWEAGNSSGFGGLSYYNKGYLLGWWLDTALMQHDGSDSRDGILALIRILLEQCRTTGYPPGGVSKAVAQIADSGVSEMLDGWVNGTAEPDWVSTGAASGLVVRWDRHSTTWFGIDIRPDSGTDTGLVTAVEPEGPAFQARLQRGDRIPHLTDVQSRIRELGPGDSLTVDVDRGGSRFALELKPVVREQVDVRVTGNPNATARQRRIRGLLSGMAHRPPR